MRITRKCIKKGFLPKILVVVFLMLNMVMPIMPLQHVGAEDTSNDPNVRHMTVGGNVFLGGNI